MSLIGEQVLLRVYLRSGDRTPHVPTCDRLIKLARAEGLAGCTVLEGIMGFGSHGIAKESPWSLVEHVPVIVEIVDSGENIQRFLTGPMLRLMNRGMATLERANVLMYRRRTQDEPRALRLGELLKKPLSTLPRIEARPPMTINENGILLRVFAGESDRAAGKPLYEGILNKSRELGLSGATVLRGTEGFGANSVVHKAKLLEMSTDLPIVIEIVDTQEKIEKLLPYLEQVVQEGMITMEYVAIVFYRHNPADAPTS